MSGAGYSATPLARKLGIGAGTRIAVERAPAGYRGWLGALPAGVVFADRVDADTRIVHVFADRRADLAADLARLRAAVRPDAAVWVSWPKKAAKVPTDVTEVVVRELALPLGFVDVKVCAVTDVWSGLKLVVRKELR
jgi:hypothetical protein